jgi:hypothetical protein
MDSTSSSASRYSRLFYGYLGCQVAWVALFVLSVVARPGSAPQAIAALAAYGLVLASAVLFLMILYHGWAVVKTYQPQVKPLLRVLLLLIPLFNVVWAFVAVAALPLRFNRIRREHPELDPVPVAPGVLLSVFPLGIVALFLIPAGPLGLSPWSVMAIGITILLGGTLVAVLYTAHIADACNRFAGIAPGGEPAQAPT